MKLILALFFPWMLLLGASLTQFLFALWVYQDAKDNPNRFFYALITFIVPGYMGLLAYLFFRDQQRKMSMTIPKIIAAMFLGMVILVALLFFINILPQQTMFLQANHLPAQQEQTSTHFKQNEGMTEEKKANGDISLHFNRVSGRRRYQYIVTNGGEIKIDTVGKHGDIQCKLYENGEEVADGPQIKNISVSQGKEYILIANCDEFSGTVNIEVR